MSWATTTMAKVKIKRRRRVQDLHIGRVKIKTERHCIGLKDRYAQFLLW